MIIPFGEETRILGNAGSWQLEKFKSVDGKPEWTPFKSFSDIRQAVSEAIAADQIAVNTPEVLDVPPQSQEFTDVVVNWLRRIEAILRNGLPHSDKDVAGTITHAHAEVEQALESIGPERWGE